MSAHHPYGPSCLGRRLLCPGSRRMEEGLDDQPTRWSLLGDRLHTLVRGTDEPRQDLEIIIGRARAKRAELIAQGSNGEPPTLLEEVRLEVDLGAEGRVFGTADVIILPKHGDLAYCLDYKFGRSAPPETAITMQLMGYATMALATYGQYSGVRAIAYYPFLDLAYETTFYDLEHLKERYRQVIAACEQEDAPLIPGEEQCQYCRALAFCPAAISTAVELVQSTENLPAIDRLTTVLRYGDSLVNLVKAARNMARKLLMQGVAVQDDEWEWVIQMRGGKRNVGDTVGAYERMKKVLPLETFLKCCRIRISDLDAVIRKLRKYNTGPRATDALRTEIASLLGPTLRISREQATLIRKPRNQEMNVIDVELEHGTEDEEDSET